MREVEPSNPRQPRAMTGRVRPFKATHSVVVYEVRTRERLELPLWKVTASAKPGSWQHAFVMQGDNRECAVRNYFSVRAMKETIFDRVDASTKMLRFALNAADSTASAFSMMTLAERRPHIVSCFILCGLLVVF